MSQRDTTLLDLLLKRVQEATSLGDLADVWQSSVAFGLTAREKGMVHGHIVKKMDDSLGYGTINGCHLHIEPE